MDLRQKVLAEKEQNLLLELPANFYDVAQKQISRDEDFLKHADTNDQLDDLEHDLLEHEILIAKQAVKQLQDLRIKKVIKAAVSDAYRSEPKHVKDAMLPDEQSLYEQIVMGIWKIRGDNFISNKI